jgi:hypothetical protein
MLKPGDILEVSCKSGVAYVHYVGKHRDYGDTIFVYPEVFRRQPNELASLDGRAGYITFYPAGAAVRQGLAKIVGSTPLPPGVQVPDVFRREAATSRTGEVTSWIVVRDGREALKRNLTAGEKQLPIASVWNHEYLVDRIVERWHPEQEG